ncbi:putative inner dynein arm light chain, axonemal [Pseudolycoriella hygida]|uniref:Inner dynein arm light chain, axonemal n=1 Tax=Pseudolycoriella hygida TaxID=35572 RepID=A0A9Q0N688_9DIPT|nr:putative inner dynein arm light chain, axonemal [Pseudolycoriella hygida]
MQLEKQQGSKTSSVLLKIGLCKSEGLNNIFLQFGTRLQLYYTLQASKLEKREVSSVPATRLDVTNLQELLDARLQQTQARDTGICSVRRDLYRQCFDEIIRQVTINCAERGFLLSRIRDEIAMSIDAYETLYCSSAAFGIRKALQAEEGKEELYEKLKESKNQCESLKQEITEMQLSFDQIQRRNEEEKESEERKHTEEVTFLKKTNAQLKSQLEGIIAPKK